MLRNLGDMVLYLKVRLVWHYATVLTQQNMHKLGTFSTHDISVFGLNSIYFETIEKQYKYFTNLSCHGLCLLAVWPGKVGRGGLKVEG